MKTFLKCSVFCTVAFVLLACGNLEEGLDNLRAGLNPPASSSSGESSSSGVLNAEIPLMDSRVVAYQHINSEWGPMRIVTDIDTLKSWFPYDLNDERAECNYFAILHSTSSTGSGYLVLSQDMVLYKLTPNYALSNECVETCDIFGEALLVCDDESGTLKNKINIKATTYTVPDWNCTDWQTHTPEKGHFPNHPRPIMPKPVMDSRVVSYQNVEYAKSKIVTNADTLELWFPHIFSNGQANPECNYFAMTFDHHNTYYEPVILSQNKYSEYVLFDVRPGGAYGENCKSVIKNEGLSGALLICDDEAFTLKNIIKPYDTPYYYISPDLYLDPNWDCESGIGAPEEIFF